MRTSNCIALTWIRQKFDDTPIKELVCTKCNLTANQRWILSDLFSQILLLTLPQIDRCIELTTLLNWRWNGFISICFYLFRSFDLPLCLPLLCPFRLAFQVTFLEDTRSVLCGYNALTMCVCMHQSVYISFTSSIRSNAEIVFKLIEMRP